MHSLSIRRNSSFWVTSLQHPNRGLVEIHRALVREVVADVVGAPVLELQELRPPGGSVRGERANFTRLVLGCIDADFCK